MRHPLRLQADLAKYIVRQKLRGVKRFPLVMMLEPLHACNLTCTGCGRIREYEDTIKEVVPLEACLAAAEECGAPMVAICGGEPLLYKEIGELTRTLLARKKHVIVCTNRHVCPQAHRRVLARHALSLEYPPGWIAQVARPGG